MTLEMKHLSSVGFQGAVSSVVEHFLDTEVKSRPPTRVIVLVDN